MGNYTIRFKCEKCKREQETTVSYGPLIRDSPAAHDPKKADVRCQHCGHLQIVSLPN